MPIETMSSLIRNRGGTEVVTCRESFVRIKPSRPRKRKLMHACNGSTLARKAEDVVRVHRHQFLFSSLDEHLTPV